MLGLEDYGSDVDSDNETTSQPAPPPALTKPKSTFSLPPPKSTTLSLPPPSNSTPSSSSSSSTTTSSAKPKKIKKIAINLPSLHGEEDDEEDEKPPAKKPRVAPSTGTGAGRSSLLGMLPAPKQPVPVKSKKNEDERVLGGGGGPGLVFRASSKSVTAQREEDGGGEAVDNTPPGPATPSFLPPSLKRGRPNVSLDTEGTGTPKLPVPPPSKSSAPAVDFFSLGSTSSSSSTTPTSSRPTSSTPTPAPSSSAPSIPTFRPPSPTLDDPHPGYYLLPSGAYAPYDPSYYASYARKWQAEYEKHIRDLEKAQYAPETDGAQEIDMAAEMDKARREIKEREERKALTMGKAGKNEDGEPEMPRMNIKGAKLGATARSRHQLTTLLTEAYLNREALEERIAQGRRNRKEAGNKYGF